MYSVPQAVRNVINGRSRRFVARLTNNGNVLSNVNSVTLNCGSNASSDFSLGTTFCACIDVMLGSYHDVEGKEFLFEIGVLVNNAYTYIPMGYFTAEAPISNSRFTKFTAYDRMQNLGVEIDTTSILDSATASDVLTAIETQTGITINVDGTLPSVGIGKPKRYTCRQVLSMIAQLIGGFACVDRNGEIRIGGYVDSGYTVTGSRYFDYTHNDKLTSITGLKCKTGVQITGDSDYLTVTDEKLLLGTVKSFSGSSVTLNLKLSQEIADEMTSGKAIYVDVNGTMVEKELSSFVNGDNPTITLTSSITGLSSGDNVYVEWSGRTYEFANLYMSSAVLSSVMDKISGFNFMGGTSTLLGDPTIDPWDIIYIVDNSPLKTPCMQVTHTFDGGLSSTVSSIAKGEEDAAYGSASPLTSEIIEANTEAKVAMMTAEAAQAHTTAINQHFMFNNTGAYVTTQNTDGMTSPTASYNRLTADGMEIVDSNGTSIASFGASTRIGDLAEGHSVIDHNSFELYDEDGNIYMFAGDGRNQGLSNLVSTFYGDGVTTQFTIVYDVSSITSVTVGGSETSNYSLSGSTITLTTAPAENVEIIVRYKSTTPIYHFEFTGSRVGLRGFDNFNTGRSNEASGQAAFVSGEGNKSSGYLASVLGGSENSATACRSAVIGGTKNTVTQRDATIVGGYKNNASNVNSAVIGGVQNTASGDASTVVGGALNTASGPWSATVGGYNNSASGNRSAVVGGYNNIASGDYSLVGGFSNQVSGDYSAVLTGFGNVVSDNNQLVTGIYNAPVNAKFVVGAGGSSSERANALSVNGFYGSYNQLRMYSPDSNATPMFEVINDMYDGNVITNNISGKQRTFTGVGRFGAYDENGVEQARWAYNGAWINGIVDVIPRRCSAGLSTVTWRRVLTYDASSAADARAGDAFVITFTITQAYGGANNGLHIIKLLGVYNSFAFVEEISRTNINNITYIRYTIDSNNKGHVDICYNATTSNLVTVDFEVCGRLSEKSKFVAESMQQVDTAPSGETVVLTYQFNANSVHPNIWHGTGSPSGGHDGDVFIKHS